MREPSQRMWSHTATLQVRTYGQSSTGNPVPSADTLLSGVPCMLDPGSARRGEEGRREGGTTGATIWLPFTHNGSPVNVTQDMEITLNDGTEWIARGPALDQAGRGVVYGVNVERRT